MLIASSDPTNFLLMLSWVISCFACAALAIYSYVRWRKKPSESLSMHLALWLRDRPHNALFGACAAMMLTFGIGMVSGAFVGHWAWPVEIPVCEHPQRQLSPREEMILTIVLRDQYIDDHPEVTQAEIEALTLERLLEIYPAADRQPPPPESIEDMLRAFRRVEQYVKDYPDATLDEIDALTPDRLAELYPEIK